MHVKYLLPSSVKIVAKECRLFVVCLTAIIITLLLWYYTIIPQGDVEYEDLIKVGYFFVEIE